jgi:hypothetical protein
MQNAGDGRPKRTSPMLDSLPPFGSLGAPTERCLSKIAHWNDRASRAWIRLETALRATVISNLLIPSLGSADRQHHLDRKEALRGIFTKPPFGAKDLGRGVIAASLGRSLFLCGRRDLPNGHSLHLVRTSRVTPKGRLRVRLGFHRTRYAVADARIYPAHKRLKKVERPCVRRCPVL